MVEKLFDDNLRTTFHHVQSGIGCVVYNAFGQDMLEMLRKEVIVKTLDAHIAKIFDTNAAAGRVSKRLLTSSSFMARVATLAQRITDTKMDAKKYSLSNSSREPMDTIKTVDEDSKSLPSRSDSGSE